MRFSHALVTVVLLTAGCSQGTNDAKSPASPSANTTTISAGLAEPTIDAADIAACSAFTAAIGRSFDLIDKAKKGEKMVPPVVVSAIVRSDAAKAREAAAAASPALKTEIERTAGSLDLMATKAADTNGATLDISVESEAVLSSTGAALKHCSTG